MKIKKLRIMMLLSVVSCAALLNGCGSSSKEGTTGGAALVDEGTCIVCHSTTTDPVSGLNLVNEYANAAHNPASGLGGSGCQGCHGGGAQHNGVGPIPFPNPLALDATGKPQCTNAACHGGAGSIIPGVVTTLNTSLNFPVLCSHCHSTTANGDLHGATVTSKVLAASGTDPDDCVFCHSVGAPQHGALVNDNSGVRAITGVNGEFGGATNRNNPQGYRAHHIYNGANADPQNAQCIACHLEGKANGPVVARDDTYHMKDGKIHLRDGNSTLTYPESSPQHTLNPDGQYEFTWDPANPNHQAMDQFCMSCHNGAGAVTAYASIALALNGMTPIAGALTPSAKNPFGDMLKNAYDGLQRPQVVAVYEQFDTGNVSHHAVRGKKYSGRTRATAITANFTKYSGATNGRIHISPTGVPQVEQFFGIYSTSGSNAGSGPLFSGSRKTIYEAGLFVAQYTTLSNTTVGDDSTLHCGDCHSVGQWKPGSTTAITYPDGVTATATPTTIAIGAHGAQNEYMLRTSDGTDALHTQGTTATAVVVGGVTTGYTATTNGTYVCYLCHRQDAYGDNNFFRTDNGVGVTAFRNHGGDHFNNGCDSLAQQSVGKVGYANRIAALGGGSGHLGTAFGYTCAHCHSSGNQVFGGIHGSASADGATKNLRFLTYSTDGTDIIGSTLPGGYAVRSYATEHDTLNVVARLPYRFMAGTGLRYNGGATASKWEAKTLNGKHREGCYNLPATPAPATTALWNTTNPLQSLPGGPGGNAILNNGGNDDAIPSVGTYANRIVQNDNATSGWGSCNHHSGSTTGGSTAPVRSVQRPLVY